MSLSQMVIEEKNNPGNLREVLECYPFSVKEVREFKGVYILQTSDGWKCLKKVFYGEEELCFVLAAMLHLQKNGFSNLASVVAAKNGEPYVATDTGCFFMTEYIHGREADYGNPIDLKLAVQTVARLHLASRGFVPPRAPENRFLWGRWPEIFLHRHDELVLYRNIIVEKENLDFFDLEYLKQLDYYIRQSYEAYERLLSTAYLALSRQSKEEGGFCHHDTAHHNLLVTSGGDPFFIDFDYCVCDSPLHDLASLILRNGKRSRWDLSTARTILRSYHAVSPLPPEAIPVIREFLRFPQDFWQLGVWKYIEKQPWPLNKYLSLLNKKTYNEKERVKFLDEFGEAYCG